MRRPSQVVCPGKLIVEELVSRLAHDIGIPDDEIQAVVRGEAPVTERIARRIGAVFGTSKDYWLNLEKQWRESRKNTEHLEAEK